MNLYQLIHPYQQDLAAACQDRVSAKLGDLNTGKQTLGRRLVEANGGG
jgi:hypothetical protein